MKITRIWKIEMCTNEFKECDKIRVGKYIATCVKVDGKDCTFLLDQYLDKLFTHENLLSNLNEYILKDENFKEINAIVKPQDIYDDSNKVLYRVPYAGEIFSGTEDDEYIRKDYEPDTKEGFLDIWECMKDHRNRIAYRENRYEFGWLMNVTKVSVDIFANVTYYGGASYYHTGNSHGVRPVFVLNNVD